MRCKEGSKNSESCFSIGISVTLEIITLTENGSAELMCRIHSPPQTQNTRGHLGKSLGKEGCYAVQLEPENCSTSEHYHVSGETQQFQCDLCGWQQTVPRTLGVLSIPFSALVPVTQHVA